MTILDRDTLGAFCRHTHVAVKGSGQGPLAGLTFGVKDIYDVEGVKTGFGSPDWLASHAPAARTAPVVSRLLAAGADMAGKTHTEEMAFSLTGENAHYGTPRNVNAPGRVPGGSSSGSAAAVAGGLVDFALGSDTGGSVRAPASFCGIYGLRPTHGRISLEGVCPLAPSFDTCGWFARDAALMERVGAVLLGGTAPRPGRLLIAGDAFDLALPEAARALEPAVARVARLLGEPASVVVSDAGLGRWFDVFRTLQFGEIWETHAEWVSRTHPAFGPGVRERFEAAARSDPQAVAAMRTAREAIACRMDELLSGNAVMILPSVPDIAPLLKSSPAQSDAFRARAMGMLCIAGLARLPQLGLPFATLNGCPLGLSLMAARGNDEMLLAIARELGAPAAC